MSTGARVESIDSIKEFRVYLAKFQETASGSLGDADSDLNKTVNWLEGEQQSYWTGQIRKKQEALAKAEEALRSKKLFKDSSGSMPSAVEEMKAVAIAKKQLADAQQKLANVKGWMRRIQKEIVLYRGGVGRFAGAVSGNVPAAIAYLGNVIEMLEKYVGIAAAGAGGEAGEVSAEGAFAGAGGASMSRAAQEAKQAEAEPAAVDPAAIRSSAPAAEVLAAAPPRGEAPFTLAVSGPNMEQLELIASVGGGPPADDARIAVEASANTAERVYLIHQPAGDGAIGWRMGSVDAAGAGEYNTITAAQLRAARPEVAELLRLPAGSLVILTTGGVDAIFDQSNQAITSAKKAASAAAAPGAESSNAEPAAAAHASPAEVNP